MLPQRSAPTTRRALLLTVLALAALLPAASHAQWTRAGTFHVRQGGRTPLAVLFPESRGGFGAVLWTCDGPAPGLMMGMRLNRGLANGTEVDVQLQVDGGEPETMRLQNLRKLVWTVGAQDAARLAERLRTASRLLVTVPRDTAPDSGAEYAYVLAGAGDALDRLGCGEQRRGRATGARTLEGAAYVPWLDVAGTLTEADPFMLPRLTNGEEVLAVINRSVPSTIRDLRAVVRFRVGKDGRPDSTSLSIVRSSRRTQFDSAAVSAVRVMRFLPAASYGLPVAVWVELPLGMHAPPNTLTARPPSGLDRVIGPLPPIPRCGSFDRC